MDLILWTDNPSLARIADAAGVSLIGVDLERVGKLDRQGHLGTFWISDHDNEDLVAVRDSLTRAKLFVRTNPVHPGLSAEIDECVELGVQTFMLPMFRTTEEAKFFVDCIDGRANAILQIETVDAANNIAEIAQVDGVAGVFVGLNDLSLDMRSPNRFELLVSDLMQNMSDSVRGNDIPFGFGGIGRLDDYSLPIPSDLIYAQYARLHATSALVARVFLRKDSPEKFFQEDLERAMQRLEEWKNASTGELEKATKQFLQALRA